LEEGRQRCFQKQILEKEVLRIQYNMQDKEVLQKDPKHRSDCRIFVKTEGGVVIKEHALGQDHHVDVMALVTKHPGQHHICLECANDEWFGAKRNMRWSLNFEILGEDETPSGQEPDKDRMATLAKMKNAQVGVDDLISRMIAISTENAYEKTFEAKFNRASEAVNTDVASFKMIQIVFLAACTAYQLKRMIAFLRSSHITCCLPMRGRSPAP